VLKFGILGPLIVRSDSGERSVPGARLQWGPLHLQRLLKGGKEPVSGDRQAADIAPPKHNNVDPAAEAAGGERPLRGQLWAHSVVVALYCSAARPGPYAPTGGSNIILRRNLASKPPPNSRLSTKPSSSSDRTWTGPVVQHS